MLGFFDLAGTSVPCTACGSTSGDCEWLAHEARCTVECGVCGGRAVGRCGYCGEVVPCGAEAGRNPRPDAVCAWDALARLHAETCRWTHVRGGVMNPLPPVVRPLE